MKFSIQNFASRYEGLFEISVFLKWHETPGNPKDTKSVICIEYCHLLDSCFSIATVLISYVRESSRGERGDHIRRSKKMGLCIKLLVILKFKKNLFWFVPLFSFFVLPNYKFDYFHREKTELLCWTQKRRFSNLADFFATKSNFFSVKSKKMINWKKNHCPRNFP